MYLTFVFYLPEDGHMGGRNMYDVIVKFIHIGPCIVNRI